MLTVRSLTARSGRPGLREGADRAFDGGAHVQSGVDGGLVQEQFVGERHQGPALPARGRRCRRRSRSAESTVRTRGAAAAAAGRAQGHWPARGRRRGARGSASRTTPSVVPPWRTGPRSGPRVRGRRRRGRVEICALALSDRAAPSRRRLRRRPRPCAPPSRPTPGSVPCAKARCRCPARRSHIGCPRLVMWLAPGLRGSGTTAQARGSTAACVPPAPPCHGAREARPSSSCLHRSSSTSAFQLNRA